MLAILRHVESAEEGANLSPSTVRLVHTFRHSHSQVIRNSTDKQVQEVSSASKMIHARFVIPLKPQALEACDGRSGQAYVTDVLPEDADAQAVISMIEGTCTSIIDDSTLPPAQI